MAQIPSDGDRIDNKSERRCSLRSDGKSARHGLRPGAFFCSSPAASKAVGGLFKSEVLFGVSKSNFELPTFGVLTQDPLAGVVFASGEKSGWFVATRGISRNNDAQNSFVACAFPNGVEAVVLDDNV